MAISNPKPTIGLLLPIPLRSCHLDAGEILATPQEIPNTQYQIPNTKYPIPNTKYQIPNTKYQIPSTKYRSLNSPLERGRGCVTRPFYPFPSIYHCLGKI